MICEQFVCRRCAVFKPIEEVTFKAESLWETRNAALKHLVEVHPIRAVKLLSMFVDLLYISNEYLDSALRDHNVEGDFNIEHVVADQAKRLFEQESK